MNTISEAEKALSNRQYKKARALFLPLLSENENRALVFQGLAECLFFMRKFDDALKNADSALNLQPNLARAHLIRAYVFARQNDPGKCKEEAKLSLELDPDSADALAFMGGLLIYEKDFSGGTAMLQRSIEIDPSNWFPYYRLGWAALIKKQPQDALIQFKISFRLKPSAQTLLRLIEIYSSIYKVWFIVLCIAMVILAYLKVLWAPIIGTGYVVLLGSLRIAADRDKRAWWFILGSILFLILYLIFYS